ncbi:MAG: CocE/NonD family hydrolase [Gemmatimonadaceae bacterium]
MTMMKTDLFVLALCTLAPAATIAAQSTTSQSSPGPDVPRPHVVPVRPPAAPAFDKTEVQIAMRDGVRLHTAIYSPKDMAANLPFLMSRTPYGIEAAGKSLASPVLADLISDGYIFVFQDIRGRYTSEGKFVMLRPMRDKKDQNAIDESTDAYDTIDWLIKNVPHNNGRVGMLGTSYPGWLTVIATLDPHPALKAASPRASPADMFIGDDFHHNGAFRLSYGFEYATMMETSKENSQFAFDQPDNYDWYLKLGSLAHVDERYLHGNIPSWSDFVTHPNYDAFWQRQAVAPYLDRVKVQTLNVAGWWDQEDFYGPVKIYETLEPHDTQHLNYLVVGPWNHGGWNAPTGQRLGDVDFGSPTSVYFRKNIEAPWFAYWLKDKGTLKLAEATTFEAGSNQWKSYNSWPPRDGVTGRKLYVRADHRLSLDPPTGNAAQKSQKSQAFDSYVSDPANPVPYRPRPILPTYGNGSTWSRWLVDDQRFVKDRPDVLSWTTPPLTGDVVIAGAISAHLLASTTGTDADWIVKLIDVYPEQYEPDPKLGGYQLMVANDVLRARFRNGFEHPQPIVPNHVDEYVVDLHTQDYRFLKGHRIMVQVQSSWFPLIDRNPQTFVPNIFDAKDSDFKAATERIFHSTQAASYIQLPIEGSASGISTTHQ